MIMMLSGALITPCQRFRTRLWRIWGEGRRLVVVMLNPSTADASANDRTIEWLIRWAKRNDYDGIEVMNVYDYRATDPRDLKRAGWLMTPHNHSSIAAVASACGGRAVCAWGAHARVEDVKNLVRELDAKSIELTYFKMNASGSPSHPLYLPGDVSLKRWDWQDRYNLGLT